MEIAVSQAQGRVPVTVLRVSGAITSNSELEQAAQAAYDGGARQILIDLTDVPYIATYGLRALHFIYTLLQTGEAAVGARPRGPIAPSPHLKLLNPSAHALEALRVAGYDLFLEIHRDPGQALASF